MKFMKAIGAVMFLSVPAAYGGTLTLVTSIPGVTLVGNPFSCNGNSVGGGVSVAANGISCNSAFVGGSNPLTFTITLATPVTSFGADAYERISWTSVTTSLAGTQDGSLSFGFTSADLFAITNTTPFDTVMIDVGDQTIDFKDFKLVDAPASAAPEPSTFAMLAPLGAGIMGLAAYRLRRKCVE